MKFEKKFFYGEIHGEIFDNYDDVHSWLDSQGDYDESTRIMNNIGDIDLPIAVLDKINIYDKYKNQKYGKSLYKIFENYCLENDCEAIMLISDSFEKQTDGFVLDIWYINLGYDVIGDLNSNSVMLKML